MVYNDYGKKYIGNKHTRKKFTPESIKYCEENIRLCFLEMKLEKILYIK